MLAGGPYLPAPSRPGQREWFSMGHAGDNQLRRVLLLARGGRINGSQRQLGYLARGLDRCRYKPIVLLDRPGLLADSLARSGIEVHIMPMRPWRSFPVGFLRFVDAPRVIRLAKRRRVDLVHASDLWRSGYMHFVARKLAVPSVLHVRGPISARDVRKHGMARADAVIAIAQRYHQDLASAGLAPDRLELIDDAVDLERFRPGLGGRDFRRELSGVNGKVLVGLVGRVNPFKRVIEFLEAISPLARSLGDRATYLVIGQPGRKPYYRSVLEAAGRLGLDSHVAFVGHRENMPETVAALDVFVTMSGGSAMFEAMACGKPVLSARADGRHSVHTRHDETAWCVTTDRPEPVTAALKRLIEDADLRERLGRTGREWVAQHLSIGAMTDRTQALYDRLLER